MPSGFPSLRRRTLLGALPWLPLACSSLAADRTYVRIAAPDRGAAQTVLALGIVPAAAVSRDFFNGMGTEPPMPEGVVDCGDPSEPNLEVLRRMQVDLIVTSTITADIRDVLSKVAPVHPLQIYTGMPKVLERAEEETRRLSVALGRGAACSVYLEMLDKRLGQCRMRLSSWKRRPVYLAGLDADGRNMTVYGRNSLMWDVMAALDVENAWSGETDAYGFTNAGVERLADRPDALILSIDYGPITQAATAALSISPFWSRLPAVMAGNVYPIRRFEVFGGLPAAVQFAPFLTDTLLSAAS